MYTGPECSTRGGRGYFKVLAQDAEAVVEAANISLGMLRVQQDAYRQRNLDVANCAAAELSNVLQRIQALDESQRRVMSTTVCEANQGPLLLGLAGGPVGVAATPSTPRTPLLTMTPATHPVLMSDVDKVYGRGASAILIAYFLDMLRPTGWPSQSALARAVLQVLRQPAHHIQCVVRQAKSSVIPAHVKMRAWPTQLCACAVVVNIAFRIFAT
jgi:hypothetical protein